MKEMISLGLRHEENKLFILDQRKLPQEEQWVQCHNPFEMAEAIRTLAIRGAPLIGVAAALSLARYAEDAASSGELKEAALILRQARPTAINLMAAVDRACGGHTHLSVTSIVETAESIFDEDVALCKKMASFGEPLINDGDNILTHCNSGGLATAGIGTALGVIRYAHEKRKKIHVFVDETRPLLQGARLTTWELAKLGISHTLICDNMAAMVMKQKKVQKIFVGSDRIAKNGDFANKIGTYGLAVLARHHGIPFYVVAPYTTVDANCTDGNAIPVEERSPAEVNTLLATGQNGMTRVFNPAFDVTPHELVTGYVLDSGFFEKPAI